MFHVSTLLRYFSIDTERKQSYSTTCFNFDIVCFKKKTVKQILTTEAE